jgi:GntR family transcriptional regulator
LLRAEGTPLHLQLFIVLRDEISRGARAPGSLMPTEGALCDRFGVSRITVRRALADLAAQGYVQRRQGLGSYVRDQLPAAMPAMNLSLLDSLKQTARETQVEVLAVKSELPPEQVRALLQLQPGEHAVHALRLRKSGEVPLMLTEAWVPERIGRKVTEAALKRKALYEILMAQGVVFGRVIQEISAEAADPYRAALLRTKVSSPLIRMTRLLHDQQDRPVQHLVALLTPERSRVLMDISSDTIDTLSAGHVAHDPRYLGARERS